MQVFDLREDRNALDGLWSYMQATWKSHKTIWKMKWDKNNKCFVVFTLKTAYLI